MLCILNVANKKKNKTLFLPKMEMTFAVKPYIYSLSVYVKQTTFIIIDVYFEFPNVRNRKMFN